MFCYSFGWLSGMLFFLFGGSNRFVRYHALQSLLFFGCINALDIAFVFSIGAFEGIWNSIPYVASVVILAFLLLNFIAFVGWLVVIVQAARGKYFKLPVAGNIAEAVTGQQITLK